jgi:hypothetical protein
MAELPELEKIASEVIETFDIKAPPVPIESMLQHPKSDMWAEVDITRLSGGFLSIKNQYSPRMSLARLLARHIIVSEWGAARNLKTLTEASDGVDMFARMLIMPVTMVRSLSASARTPTTLSLHFEVPEDDARERLMELANYL